MRWSHGIVLAALVLVGCQSLYRSGGRDQGASGVATLSAFTIREFQPKANDPAWANVDITLHRADSGQEMHQRFSHSQFQGVSASTVILNIPPGYYYLMLIYTDASNRPVYKLCDNAAHGIFPINTPQFSTELPICRADTSAAEGTVGLVPAAPLASAAFPPSASCRDGSGRVNVGFDDVAGYCVDRTQAYFVQSGEIYNHGQKIFLKGITWLGLEGGSDDPSGQKTVDLQLGGLGTNRTMESFVDQMAVLGFNAWRLPLAPEALDQHTPSNDGFKTIQAEIEHFLDYANSKGMYVILDLHNCGKDRYRDDKPGPGLGSSGCASYTEARWTADLCTLANLARAHPNVVGIDLFNEPYGFSWSDWAQMASRAANAVLHTNPTLLVFVEGVGAQGSKSPTPTFRGENLVEAGTTVPPIPASRLVYAPHVAGPSVADQPYFDDNAFPSSMPDIWAKHFGYLKAGGYALAIGSFGGTYRDKDRTWNDAFVNYLQKGSIEHFFYSAMNQDTKDTGGLFVDDQWTVVNRDKINLLRPLLDRQP